MSQKTPLYAKHVSLGARIVDFGGWDMPLHYGSQLDEHHEVRQHSGMFDVSHMTVVDLCGTGSRSFLRHLLANDVSKLKQEGKALYSCMLNAQGGVVDDLIVYWMGEDRYRLVVNASTREKDLDWIHAQSTAFSVEIEERAELAMIAVQGPEAREKTAQVLGASVLDISRFQGVEVGEAFVARTGYTGEDGFEVMIPQGAAESFWQSLLDVGVKPCGLGARDTLRLEAGMNLYGQDMDQTTTPLESGLSWTVAWQPEDRDFIGRAALQKQKQQGDIKRFVGLVLLDRGVLRHGQELELSSGEQGEVTSGGFSPTTGKAIAFARIPAGTDTQLNVIIRGKRLNAQIVKPSFVRNGKSLLENEDS